MKNSVIRVPNKRATLSKNFLERAVQPFKQVKLNNGCVLEYSNGIEILKLKFTKEKAIYHDTTSKDNQGRYFF